MPTDALAVDVLGRAARFAPGTPIRRKLLHAAIDLPAEDLERALVFEDAIARLVEWRVVDGAQINQIAGGVRGLVLAISRDGLTLAQAASNSVWILRPGEEPRLALVVNTTRISCLAINPNDTILAAGSHDNTVMIWRIEQDGKLVYLHTLGGHARKVHCVAWSPDGETLLSGSGEGKARLWRARDGVRLWRYGIYTLNDGIRSAAWSPDGRFIAIGHWEGKISILRAEDGAVHQSISAVGAVLHLAWSPDGARLISVSQQEV